MDLTGSFLGERNFLRVRAQGAGTGSELLVIDTKGKNLIPYGTGQEMPHCL
jgi:hypothetical protein